jgi:hypothetical protein
MRSVLGCLEEGLMGSVLECLEHVPETETISIYSSTQFVEPRRKQTVALLEGPCSGYLMRLQAGVSPGGVTAGLTGARGPPAKMAQTHCWQAGAGCWQEEPIPCYRELSKRLLENSQDMVAGFMERK